MLVVVDLVFLREVCSRRRGPEIQTSFNAGAPRVVPHAGCRTLWCENLAQHKETTIQKTKYDHKKQSGVCGVFYVVSPFCRYSPCVNSRHPGFCFLPFPPFERCCLSPLLLGTGAALSPSSCGAWGVFSTSFGLRSLLLILGGTASPPSPPPALLPLSAASLLLWADATLSPSSCAFPPILWLRGAISTSSFGLVLLLLSFFCVVLFSLSPRSHGGALLLQKEK